MTKNILGISAAILLSSCAVLHHIQVGDIDNRKGQGKRFEILYNETGVNFDEAASIGKGMTRSKKAQEDIEFVRFLIEISNMGPRTGNPTFNDTYSDGLLADILKECPSGLVTGVTSIREMNKYPVISGEIVKVTGYCMSGSKG